MKKEFNYLVGIGILVLCLSIGVFTLLQNEKIYTNTLGRISQNYERVGTWNEYEIKKVSKPYRTLVNEDLVTWDAAIYECISVGLYATNANCYNEVKAAFFPLFPIVWKLTHSTTSGISLINYLLFILSIAALVELLLKTNFVNKLTTYIVLITLPSSVIYAIPYSESLFLLTMTSVAYGLLHKKQNFVFVGCLLMAMVRPATAFVLIAFLCVEFIIWLQNKNFKLFLKSCSRILIPFMLGYMASIGIQKISSGSWLAYVNAQKNWVGSVRLANEISDWSVEGYSLSLIALFFVCIPAFVFAIWLMLSFTSATKSKFIHQLSNYNSEYLVTVSAFYLVGILVFTLLTSGGNLHSVFRFVLCSPLFYIALLYVLNYAHSKATRPVIIGITLSIVLLVLFLLNVKYGGDKLQFSFCGMYLYIGALLLLVKQKTSSNILLIASTMAVVFFNIIWNTYMFNAFLSNGWIFT